MRCGMVKSFLKRALLAMTAATTFVAGVCSLTACSSDDKVAGVSTVETENAFVIQVVDGDGLPVTNAKAVMRTANYLHAYGSGFSLEPTQGINVMEDENGNSRLVEKVFTSDSVGYVRIDTLFADSMTLEILNNDRGAFTLLLADDIEMGDSTEIAVSLLGVMTGKIDLPEGSDGAWIQVYGTDRTIKTDSEGYYKIEGMAPAEYRVHVVVGDTTMDDVVTVKSGEIAEPESSSSEEPAAVSSSSEFSVESSAESSSSAPLGYLDVLDFENGLGSVYLKPTDTTVTMYPVEDSASLAIVDAGLNREGKAFHWATSGETGHWSFMGLWMCSSSNPCDFSGIDSVEYYVRGTGSYSFNLEAIVEGTTGKAVFLDTLGASDEWERVVVKPSDFMEGDSTYGNMGWEYVSKQATNIAVCAYFDTELWIDDIKFYGVNEDDLK